MAAPRVSLLRPDSAIVIAAWALFIALAWGPVGALLAQAVGRLVAGDAEAWGLLLPSVRRALLLARSLGLSLAAAGLAGGLGGLAALAFLRLAAGRRLTSGRAAVVIAGLAVWVIAPPYLHALAGLEAAAALGGALPLPDLPGWVLVVLVQAFALLPLPAVAALLGLMAVEPDRVEAGLMLGRDARVFARIVWPLAAPALAAGTVAVFVLVLLDSSTPSLFGVPSYAMEVVAEFGASHAAWRAALVALPLIGLAGLAVAGLLLALRAARPGPGRSFGGGLARHRPLAPMPFAANVALGSAALYAVLILAVLLAGLTLWRLLPGLVWDLRRDLWVTLANALLAGGLALIPASLIGWQLASVTARPARRLALWAVVLLPLALPPALTGAGLAALLTAHAPLVLRNAPLLPALALAARFLPFAVLIVAAQMRRIDPQLVEAARLQRRPGPGRWRLIEAPLAAPGLWAAFGLVFCASIGELDATLMTAAPGAGLLSMRVFNYLHYGVSDTVAALGLVLVALIWLGAAGGLWLARRGSVA